MNIIICIRGIENVSNHLAELTQSISDSAQQQASAAASISDSMNVIQEVTTQIKDDPVVALSMSSMGEALTPVSHDREILGNCILGFDPRGVETVAALESMDPVRFFEISGNVPGAIYAGPKLIWLRDNRPDLFERAYKFLGWQGLVVYLLGCDPVIDRSLANRTLFLDLRVIARDMSYSKLEGQGLRVIFNAIPYYRTRDTQITIVDFIPLQSNFFNGEEILSTCRG